MPSDILIEEYHLSFFVRSSLPVTKQNAIARALKQPGFRNKLQQAIRAVLRRHTVLKPVRFSLSS